MENNCICPICTSRELKTLFVHPELKTGCYECAICKHIFNTNVSVIIPDTIFMTDQNRANAYIEQIVTFGIDSLCELGSAPDFYFLRTLHAQRPGIKLYTLNFPEKDTIPEFVTPLADIADIRADFLYSTHTLEHIPNLHVPMRAVKNFKDFLFEVPNCHPGVIDSILCKQKTYLGWHYHFFNTDSFRRLFHRYEISPVHITVFDDGYDKYGGYLAATSKMGIQYRGPVLYTTSD